MLAIDCLHLLKTQAENIVKIHLLRSTTDVKTHDMFKIIRLKSILVRCVYIFSLTFFFTLFNCVPIQNQTKESIYFSGTMTNRNIQYHQHHHMVSKDIPRYQYITNLTKIISACIKNIIL